MEDFKSYRSLVKYLYLNSLKAGNTVFGRSLSIRSNRENKKKSAISSLIITIIIGLIFMFYSGMMGFSIAKLTIPNGYYKEALDVIMLIGQLVVLFFGILTLINNVYLSTDNAFLMTLPVKPQVIFASKFTLSYINEILFSVAISLPMLITYGITATDFGIAINIGYYVVSILFVAVLPIIPFFIAGFISIPFMYLITYLRKYSGGTTILMLFLYGGFFALYFSFMFITLDSTNAIDDGNLLMTDSMIKAFKLVSKIEICNYHVSEALLGNNVVHNYIIYIVFNIFLLAIVFVMSAYMYRRVMYKLAENDGINVASKKQNIKEEKQMNYVKSFLLKEVRTLIRTPSLLVGTIIGIALPVVFVFFVPLLYGQGMEFEEGDTVNGMFRDLFITGLSLMFCALMGSTTNVSATLGFSKEGKQLYFLKTLPISSKDIIKIKLYFSCIFSILFAIIIAIVFPISSKITNPMATFAIVMVLAVTCFGSNCMMLKIDLKNPKLNWTNINEITNNNKRGLFAVIPMILLGFYYLAVGVILGSIPTVIGNEFIEYLIFFIADLIPASIYAVICYNGLMKKCEEYWNRIGE